jgi:hypothetical protein
VRTTILLLAAILPSSAAGQVVVSDSTSSPRLGCFRGAPADRCRLFALTEAGVYLPLSGRGPAPVLVTYSLGFMANAGAREAVGLAGFASWEQEIRAGVAVRYRRWLGRRHSFDFAVGVHLAGSEAVATQECYPFYGGPVCNNSRVSRTVGPVAPMIQARYNYRDLVALSSRLDLLSQPRLYVGTELGGEPGIVVQGLSLAAIGIAALVFTLTWDGPFSGMN